MENSFFQKKLFGRLNVMDILLIALIAALLIGAGVKMYSSWRSGKAKQFPAALTFTAQNVPGYVAAKLAQGEACGDLSKNVDLGSVISLSETQDGASGFTVVLQTGGVTASAEADGIKIAGQEYLIGQQTALQVGDATLNASLTGFNKP